MSSIWGLPTMATLMVFSSWAAETPAMASDATVARVRAATPAREPNPRGLPIDRMGLLLCRAPVSPLLAWHSPAQGSSVIGIMLERKSDIT